MAGSPVRIGVDAGTTLAKAAAFDDSGTLIATAARPVGLRHPQPSWTEQDQDEMTATVADCVATVAAQVHGRRVESVAITSQGDGCWLTDDCGRPLRPGISWMDGRAADLLADWSADGTCEAVFAENGSMLFPGASGAILAWLDLHEPAALDRATTAGFVKDVLLQRFSGLRATDSANASVPLHSVRARGGDCGPAPDGRVLALTGLSHRAELLAPVRRPLPVGELRQADLGLPTGVPVVSAPFDIPACGIGAGVHEVGEGLLIMGTTLACAVLTDRLDLSGPPAGSTVALPDGRWLRLMAAMAGTAGLDWTLAMLGLSFEVLDDVLADSPPGANGVAVLPYLAPSGERAPFVDPAARAQFGGLSITTTRSDLVRGLCEGLAFVARSCFELAGPPGPVYACGGGSRSRTWLQIMASVLNREVRAAPHGQVGARGAVLAGAQALGTPLDRATWIRHEPPVLPIPADVERYEDSYQRFRTELASARARWIR